MERKGEKWVLLMEPNEGPMEGQSCENGPGAISEFGGPQ